MRANNVAYGPVGLLTSVCRTTIIVLQLSPEPTVLLMQRPLPLRELYLARSASYLVEYRLFVIRCAARLRNMMARSLSPWALVPSRGKIAKTIAAKSIHKHRCMSAISVFDWA